MMLGLVSYTPPSLSFNGPLEPLEVEASLNLKHAALHPNSLNAKEERQTEVLVR